MSIPLGSFRLGERATGTAAAAAGEAGEAARAAEVSDLLRCWSRSPRVLRRGSDRSRFLRNDHFEQYSENDLKRDLTFSLLCCCCLGISTTPATTATRWLLEPHPAEVCHPKTSIAAPDYRCHRSCLSCWNCCCCYCRRLRHPCSASHSSEPYQRMPSCCRCQRLVPVVPLPFFLVIFRLRLPVAVEPEMAPEMGVIVCGSNGCCWPFLTLRLTLE